MADNANLTAGDGTLVAATDNIAGVNYQRIKLSLGPDGTAVDADAGAGATSAATLRTVSASDDPSITALTTINTTLGTPMKSTGGTVGVVAGSAIIGKIGIDQTTDGTTNLVASKQSGTWTVVTSSPFADVIQVDVVLPTSTVYTANDAMSDSTSAPTSGGFSFANAAPTSGGVGAITGLVVTSSADPTLLLSGELWVFDQSVTAINDNAVFAVSDTDIKKLVAIIPFQLADSGAVTGNNSIFTVSGLNIPFKAVGSRDLRFLLKAKNPYLPATDTLTFKLGVVS